MPLGSAMTWVATQRSGSQPLRCSCLVYNCGRVCYRYANVQSLFHTVYCRSKLCSWRYLP